MKLNCLLIAIILVAGNATAAPPTSRIKDGVYKHLDYVEESGDLLGMALHIKGGASPTVVHTTCEGGCFGGIEWPLRVSGKTISFTVCDEVLDKLRQPAPCQPITYAGHISRKGSLIISVVGEKSSRLVLNRVPYPKPREVEMLACAGRC